jgi:predicted DNA-binding ribbon-helix-helix protein
MVAKQARAATPTRDFGGLAMCTIFSGQDPANCAFETRSVRLQGYSTSVRLERRFWEILEEICDNQRLPMAKFLSQVYDEALEIHGDVPNFASLLRCSCLVYLTDPKAKRQPSKAA